MIAFPLVASLVALASAVFLGSRFVRHPRPENLIWTMAFAVFAIAAAAELAGSIGGWSGPLVRVYYLTGAVLVVGVLALGELYLLFPERVPAFVPGLALLTAAIAATAVWSAAVDQSRLQTEGWNALVRDPFLIALTVTINAGGTLVLVAGTLYSAWRIFASGGSRRRAAGCALIAGGTVVVALGGTLTRLGHREYLYLAMALGVAIIFAGVVLASGTGQRRTQAAIAARRDAEIPSERPPITALPLRVRSDRGASSEAVRYVVEQMLALDEPTLATACRRWSATATVGETWTREQAKQVWSLRLALPADARARFDLLSPQMQAQLAELFVDIWSNVPAVS